MDVQKVLCYLEKAMAKVIAVQEHEKIWVKTEYLGCLLELCLVNEVHG